MVKFIRHRALLLALSFMVSSSSLLADNIYVMNAPGYNTATTGILTAMTDLGHTLTINTTDFDVMPPNFVSACIDPVNGYHWLCFFGDYDYSDLSAEVHDFINDGGKVYYNYEVSCCTTSSSGAAAMVAAITGLPVTTNVAEYISIGGGPAWEADLGCITITGNAYKCFDGLPAANQLNATASINGGSPDVSSCYNFGYFFTGDDIPGNTLGGSITGMGDINSWFSGSEPGAGPVDTDLVAYFFPNETTTCHLAVTGCATTCPFTSVLGPDQAICAGETLTLDAEHPDATGYDWDNNSTGTTRNVSAAGTYWVTVTDGTETCTDSIHITVTTVTATASADVSICQGSSTILSVNAGTAYSWTPAGSLNFSDLQSVEATPSSTTTYTVTLFQGDCSDTDDVTVTVIPADVDYEVNTIAAICDIQGSIEITSVTGGQGPYTLQLDNVDINEGDIIALDPATYSLVITDNIGCELSDDIVVEDDSYNLNATISSENPLCEIPGVIDVENVTGASGAVTYYLNSVVQADESFEDLNAGNFTVRVEDENGCEDEAVINLVLQTNNLTYTLEESDPICTTLGWIEVSNIANGLPPYVLSFEGAPTGGGAFEDLTAGNYDFNITDAAGCEESFNVVLTPASSTLSAEIEATPLHCELPGHVESIVVSGGQAPYTISIDGEPYSQGNFQVSDTEEHEVHLVDVNGCTGNEIFQVENINITEASFTAVPYIAHAPVEVVFTNASVNATDYIWNLGLEGSATTKDYVHTFLEPGNYPVVLTATDDITGCVDTALYIIYVSPPNSLYIPNTFTPDNDGINDVFMVKGENISVKGYSLFVFNRWGDAVWTSKSPDDVWTGSVKGGDYFVPDGVYPFHMEYSYTDSPDKVTIVGNILVVR